MHKLKGRVIVYYRRRFSSFKGRLFDDLRLKYIVESIYLSFKSLYLYNIIIMLKSQWIEIQEQLHNTESLKAVSYLWGVVLIMVEEKPIIVRENDGIGYLDYLKKWELWVFLIFHTMLWQVPAIWGIFNKAWLIYIIISCDYYQMIIFWLFKKNLYIKKTKFMWESLDIFRTNFYSLKILIFYPHYCIYC